jgi:putative iron-regulated protein
VTSLDNSPFAAKMKLKVMFKSGLGSLIPLVGLSWACSGDPGGAAPIPVPWEEVAVDARVTYAEIAFASYEDSHASATELDTALRALVEDPSQANLDAARSAWIDSREPYLQTEVYRFYGGPIDDPTEGPEGLINAWPLDENYIDYVEDDPTAGIINDPDQVILTEELAGLNEAGGEKNIATGYHAIEFLLWGQDLSATGPGDRPYTDYVTGGEGTAENQDRRGEYLLTVSGLLLDHLSYLADAWSEGDVTNYRAEFRRIEPEETIQRILTGMILLTGNETGGERLQAALVAQDQEEEHSCFSDNTHRDMIQDVQGVLNVWNGSYTRLDGSEVTGTGIADVVRAENRALADEIDDKLGECLDLANALVRPFDREIAAGNPEGEMRVTALIVALNDAAELFEDAFRGFNLQVPMPPA